MTIFLTITGLYHSSDFFLFWVYKDFEFMSYGSDLQYPE